MSEAEIGVAAISVYLLLLNADQKLNLSWTSVFDFIMECLVCYIAKKHHIFFKFI